VRGVRPGVHLQAARQKLMSPSVMGPGTAMHALKHRNPSGLRFVATFGLGSGAGVYYATIGVVARKRG
jgi:hypothetical protein